jgi:TPR repeat protein
VTYPSVGASPNATQSQPPILNAPGGLTVISRDEIGASIARGDFFFSNGDIASARLYYERAANAGEPGAALRLGETFDPAFLGRANIRGVQGDPVAAARWYRRAFELGAREAEELLNTLENH